jgi:hypothetical protein
MRSLIYIFLITSLILIDANVSKGQSIAEFEKRHSETGIPIKKKEFDDKVSKYLTMMSNWSKFTVEEYIDMVRLYNTIAGPILKNDFYKMYYTVFLVMYSKPAAKELEATLSKGMAMHSNKYHIWIGGGAIPDYNSQFRVDTTLVSSN